MGAWVFIFALVITQYTVIGQTDEDKPIMHKQERVVGYYQNPLECLMAQRTFEATVPPGLFVEAECVQRYNV